MQGEREDNPKTELTILSHYLEGVKRAVWRRDGEGEESLFLEYVPGSSMWSLLEEEQDEEWKSNIIHLEREEFENLVVFARSVGWMDPRGPE